MLKKHRVEELRQEKKILARLFQSKCYVCHRAYGTKGKGFTFHHIDYIPGEKSYRDFPIPREYQEYILPKVRSHPSRYALLCRNCHRAVEIGKKYNPDTYGRLYKLVKRSR